MWRLFAPAATILIAFNYYKKQESFRVHSSLEALLRKSILNAPYIIWNKIALI